MQTAWTIHIQILILGLSPYTAEQQYWSSISLILAVSMLLVSLDL